jgi:hypothetical protein
LVSFQNKVSQQFFLLYKFSDLIYKFGKKPGKFEKTHGNGKNWFLPGNEKNGKNCLFSKYLFKIHWQINDEMF